jgi:hypothetical protein
MAQRPAELCQIRTAVSPVNDRGCGLQGTIRFFLSMNTFCPNTPTANIIVARQPLCSR